MSDFSASWLGRLRAMVGPELMLLPGARVIIEDCAGRYLLQLRSDFGVWGLPGGMPEPGETLLQCVVREVGEETGLRIDQCEPFGFGSDPAIESQTYPYGDRCQFFVLNFHTASFHGELAADVDESLRLAWFAPDALPAMLPNMRRSIEAWQAFRREGVFQLF